MDEIFFESFYFEVLTTLQNSLFINSILSNSSVWYTVQKEEMKMSEQCNAEVLSQGLSTMKKTSTMIMYLEMGWIPIWFIMMSQRLMYLFKILNEKYNSMIFNFLQAQLAFPLKNNWVSTVKEDLKSLS